MEKLIILGTGNAQALQCYNTCFALQKGDDYFLIDAGGGNAILSQLEKAAIPLTAIGHMFVSHTHSDHILGAVWMVRMVAAAQAQGKYAGDFHLYAHQECMDALQTMVNLTVKSKLAAHMGKSIVLHTLSDGQTESILGDDIIFFDIGSTKCKQFGFAIGKDFCFLGDEPYREHEEKYAKGTRWLLHEAFCRYADRDVFKPYEKHHATVKEACETAQKLSAKNLILYHTEDKHIKERKALYQREGAAFFSGTLYVPDDLEAFDLA